MTHRINQKTFRANNQIDCSSLLLFTDYQKLSGPAYFERLLQVQTLTHNLLYKYGLQAKTISGLIQNNELNITLNIAHRFTPLKLGVYKSRIKQKKLHKKINFNYGFKRYGIFDFHTFFLFNNKKHLNVFDLLETNHVLENNAFRQLINIPTKHNGLQTLKKALQGKHFRNFYNYYLRTFVKRTLPSIKKTVPTLYWFYFNIIINILLSKAFLIEPHADSLIRKYLAHTTRSHLIANHAYNFSHLPNKLSSQISFLWQTILKIPRVCFILKSANILNVCSTNNYFFFIKRFTNVISCFNYKITLTHFDTLRDTYVRICNTVVGETTAMYYPFINFLFIVLTSGSNEKLLGLVIKNYFERIRFQQFQIRFLSVLERNLKFFVHHFSRQTSVYGIRIDLHGRIKKNTRSIRYVMNIGKISLTTTSSNIKTEYVTAYTRNAGAIGVKIFINQG